MNIHASGLAVVDEVLVEDRIGLAPDLHTGDPIGVYVISFHVALATVKDKEATVLAMVHLGGGAGGKRNGRSG